MKKKKCGKLIVPYNDLILVDFDNARSVIGQHLVINFIDDTFILEPGEIIDFIQLQRIDEVTGFVNQSDLDISGQMAP
jgi:hypothetical protein